MVGVAQLVEPRIVIPVVVGSSPIVHPKFLDARGISGAQCETGNVLGILPVSCFQRTQP